jgi:hypothetical protein
MRAGFSKEEIEVYLGENRFGSVEYFDPKFQETVDCGHISMVEEWF